jgi:drug/metabolite transporter (DMT)-like permease
MEPMKETNQKGFQAVDLQLFIVVLIFGATFSVIKPALKEINPLVFVFLRFLLSSILLFPVMIAFVKEITLKDLRDIIVMGLIGVSLFQISFHYGLAHTTATNASLIMGISPIFTTLFGVISGVDRLSLRGWLGVLIAFSGVYLVMQGKDLMAFHLNLRGDVLVLLGSACWALYTLLGRPILIRHSPLKVTAWAVGIGTLGLIPATCSATLEQDWSMISISSWLGLAYSAILATVLGFLLWFRGVSKVGPIRAMVYQYMTPIIAVLIAWATLGDRMNGVQILGACLAMMGVLMARRN